MKITWERTLLQLFNTKDKSNERSLTTKVMFADPLELAKNQTKLPCLWQSHLNFSYNKSRVASFTFSCNNIIEILYKNPPSWRGRGCNPFISLVPETDEHVTSWFDSLKATSFITTEFHFSFSCAHPYRSGLDFWYRVFILASALTWSITAGQQCG